MGPKCSAWHGLLIDHQQHEKFGKMALEWFPEGSRFFFFRDRKEMGGKKSIVMRTRVGLLLRN